MHTHMTNTRITDAEIFERRYPVILRDFSLRRGSGGAGLHCGGDGVIRDIEFRHAVEASILSERRVHRPYGLHGGADADCGVNYWIRRVQLQSQCQRQRPGLSSSKSESEFESIQRTINLGAKNTASMQPGDRIIICTPGGGGWGASPEHSAAQDADTASTARSHLSSTTTGTTTKKKRKWDPALDPKHSWRGGSFANRAQMQETS